MDKPKLLSLTLTGLIVSLVAAWGLLSIAWRSSSTLDLSIAAFQAHNWLYGEHLLYRVQLESDESCQPQDHYACLSPIEFSSHSFGKSCLYQMKGECQGEHFLTKVGRFYLSQQNKLSIQYPRYSQQGTLKLKVSRLGPVFVEDFSFGR